MLQNYVTDEHNTDGLQKDDDDGNMETTAITHASSCHCMYCGNTPGPVYARTCWPARVKCSATVGSFKIGCYTDGTSECDCATKTLVPTTTTTTLASSCQCMYCGSTAGPVFFVRTCLPARTKCSATVGSYNIGCYTDATSECDCGTKTLVQETTAMTTTTTKTTLKACVADDLLGCDKLGKLGDQGVYACLSRPSGYPVVDDILRCRKIATESGKEFRTMSRRKWPNSCFLAPNGRIFWNSQGRSVGTHARGKSVYVCAEKTE